jgi:hypothetical protein
VNFGIPHQSTMSTPRDTSAGAEHSEALRNKIFVVDINQPKVRNSVVTGSSDIGDTNVRGPKPFDPETISSGWDKGLEEDAQECRGALEPLTSQHPSPDSIS